MPESRKVAVILARHDTTQAPPAADDVRTFLLTSPYSVARYWTEASYGWIRFDRFDFFGWHDVALAPPPSSRANTADIAKAAVGRSLEDYDLFVVVLFPGRVGATLYDAGAVGTTAVVRAFDTHAFAAHEVGHALGFDHTYGILNTGGDQDGDTDTEYFPVYGDPYDIMSAESFGGSDPTVDYAVTFGIPALGGLPNAWIGGPLPSRALLHFRKPLALETAGKVRHVREGGDDLIARLEPAGGGSGLAELLVYHPSDERGDGMGRVYVEYRQAHPHVFGTRWDAGLANAGDERDRAGVIVHVVRPVPGTDTPAIWYAGRLVMPTADLDVEVDAPGGPVRISLSEASAGAVAPPWVDVRANRSRARFLVLRSETEETRRVISEEQREIPGWAFAGTFTWERRLVTRTLHLKPVVAGLGGGGSHQDAEVVSFRWLVAGEPVVGGAGTISVTPSSVSRPVALDYAVDSGTHRLTLSNRPEDGAYVVAVVCEAHGRGDPVPLVVETAYEAPPVEEGWGADHQRFTDYFDRLTHPIPAPRPRPPGWGLDLARWALDRIAEVRFTNPQAAAVMQDALNEMRRVGRVPA